MATTATKSAVGALTNIALQPVVPASVLAFLAYAPRDVVNRVFNPATLQRLFGARDIRKGLKVLLALGLIRTINRFMSKWALNNWSLSAQGNWDWQGELAVVTGGCSGIGRCIALGLAARGVQVAILDVQDLTSDMESNRLIKYWKCDITSPESVREVADEIRLKLGHASILVNNAGVSTRATLLETSNEVVQKTLRINLESLWYTTKEFLPNMVLKNKGHILTVASMASYVPLPSAISYSASKAGALAFGEGLSAEIKHIFKAPGVMSTVVHPMWVSTPMTDPYAKDIVQRQGPMMQPEMVSKAVLDQIFSCRGGHLFVPDRAAMFPLLRSMPSWLQQGLLDLTFKRAEARAKLN